MKGSPLSIAIGIRVVSVVLALVLVCLLPQQAMLFAVIVLGWGHFLLAYIYQAEGGHLGYRKIAFLAAMLVFFTWAGLTLPTAVFSVLTTIAFLLHFAIDEPRLLGTKHSIYTTLEALPFVLIYSALLLQVLLNSHNFFLACGLVVLILVGYAWLSYKNKRKPNRTSYSYLAWLLLTIGVYIVSFTIPTVTILQLFAGLVIVHYLIWYGFYWFKLINKTFIQREYVLRAVLINILVAIFASFWLIGAAPIFSLFFTVTAFNVWTFLHGVSSTRTDELMSSVQVS
jgi:hypothetical protein